MARLSDMLLPDPPNVTLTLDLPRGVLGIWLALIAAAIVFTPMVAFLTWAAIVYNVWAC